MRRVKIFTRTIRQRNLEEFRSGLRGGKQFPPKKPWEAKIRIDRVRLPQNSQEMGRVFHFLSLFLYIYFSFPPLRTPTTRFQPAQFSAWRLWCFLLYREFLEGGERCWGLKSLQFSLSQLQITQQYTTFADVYDGLGMRGCKLLQ